MKGEGGGHLEKLPIITIITIMIRIMAGTQHRSSEGGAQQVAAHVASQVEKLQAVWSFF